MTTGPDYLNRKGKSRGSGPDYLGSPKGNGPNWRKHEEDVASRSGGYRRAASGAAPGKPGDTVDEEFLRECKSTSKSGITINGKWISKISEEALALGKIPIIEIRLEGQTAPTPTDWVMLPSTEFEAIKERTSS